jgi:putative membrane protein
MWKPFWRHARRISNLPATPIQMPANSNPYLAVWPVSWALIFLLGLIWSLINPADYPTWALEVAPAVIGFFLLVVTRKTFPLTTLCYSLILIHCLVLMVGGHYTYAEVPLFDTISEVFHQSRNNFDKLGHFLQGLVPAIICREIVIRRNIIPSKFFTFFFTVCFCLALSALYELLEWWVAVLSDEAAEAFLGTQGYIWDTQSDMAWALSGAIIAFITLSKIHDKQINHLQEKIS